VRYAEDSVCAAIRSSRSLVTVLLAPGAAVLAIIDDPATYPAVVQDIVDHVCSLCALFDPPDTVARKAVLERVKQVNFGSLTAVCTKNLNPNVVVIAADGEDAARRTRQRGQDIPAGSNRSPFHNTRSAMAIAARSADPECLSPEGGG
jgi:hypothetical protein